MGLETTVLKSRGVYLNKDLIRSLLRLKLQLKNNRNLIANRRTIASTASSSSKHNNSSQRIIANSTSATTSKSATASSGPASSSSSTIHSGPNKNAPLIRNGSHRYYSTSSKNKENSHHNNQHQNHNKRSKHSTNNSNSNMKVLASNVLAAVFFTSLLVEESYIVNRGKGVLRYDVAQLPSNNPIEDARSEQIIQVPIETESGSEINSDWLFFGVYDGHAGYNTSKKLKNELIGQIIGELTDIYKLNDASTSRIVPDSNTIDQAIRSGFLKLDDEIVNKAVDKLFKSPTKSGVSEFLMPLLSGSCALLSFYDTHTQVLKVAVTGDSRLILGSLDNDNQWTVEQLSIDQTGSNPSEVSRMIREHPNEPDVVKRGRVLGSLEPSRSFGDARYKWTQKIQEKIYNQFFGRKSPPNLLTPPYVTLEPVISTTKIDPLKNQFLVMASDGLYEMLTNEEIVGLVVRWMESQNMITKTYDSSASNSFLKFFQSANSTSEDPKKLPKVIDISASPELSKQLFRRTTPPDQVSFLLEDANVSTHLIRNALSNGGSKEHSEMLASIPSPLSRRYRDDLTVTVVFFGNQGDPNDLGKLEMNFNGTNEKGGNVEPKPKL